METLSLGLHLIDELPSRHAYHMETPKVELVSLEVIGLIVIPVTSKCVDLALKASEVCANFAILF